MCLADILEGKMEKIKIGQVVNVVGLSGEVKIYSYAEDPSRFEKLDRIFLGEELYPVEKVRYKANMPIVKVAGIDDRNGGEKMRGRDVFMAEEDLEDLPPGEYYIKDLLGFDVITQEGEHLGKLKDISTATAQKLYCVEKKDGKMLYIPGVPQFILEKNVKDKIVKVALPKGLLEL
jgi:16S rRNA processing protein RimM